MLIDELIANFHLKEQSFLVEIMERTRLFMFSSLEQVNTIGWTVEHYLALLAATLGTDAVVHGRAETFFFSFFTERATHESYLQNDYPTCRSMSLDPVDLPSRWLGVTEKPVFMGFLKPKMKKTA